LALEPSEYTLETVVDSDGPSGGSTAVTVLPGGGFLVLNTEVTAELAAEGTARDVIRSIQQARRDADLHISDRVLTTVEADADTLSALQTHAGLVKQETLTDELALVAASPEANGVLVKVVRQA
jgi:isoleucyl-tRNA synthetase